MLSFLMSLIGGIIPNWKVIAATSAIALLTGLYTGNRLTVLYFEGKELRAVQAQLNHTKKVIEAQTKYATELREKELKLEADLEDALEAARNSPTAGNTCLPLDGVRRLDKIR